MPPSQVDLSPLSSPPPRRPHGTAITSPSNETLPPHHSHHSHGVRSPLSSSECLSALLYPHHSGRHGGFGMTKQRPRGGKRYRVEGAGRGQT